MSAPPHNPAMDGIIKHSVEALLSLAENTKYEPFGLIEYRGPKRQLAVVEAFDSRDPFGHLGIAVAHTLESTIAQFDLPDDYMSSALDNSFSGSVVSGYLLAGVARTCMRESPESVFSGASLAEVARDSYSSLPKKLSARHTLNSAFAIRALFRNVRGTSLLRDDFQRHYPFKRNPFRLAALTMREHCGRRFVGYRDAIPEHDLTEDEIVAYGFKIPEEGIHACSAGRVKVETANGVSSALRAQWMRMTDIAEPTLFSDPEALAWAYK